MRAGGSGLLTGAAFLVCQVVAPIPLVVAQATPVHAAPLMAGSDMDDAALDAKYGPKAALIRQAKALSATSAELIKQLEAAQETPGTKPDAKVVATTKKLLIQWEGFSKAEASLRKSGHRFSSGENTLLSVLKPGEMPLRMFAKEITAPNGAMLLGSAYTGLSMTASQIQRNVDALITEMLENVPQRTGMETRGERHAGGEAPASASALIADAGEVAPGPRIDDKFADFGPEFDAA